MPELSIQCSVCKDNPANLDNCFINVVPMQGVEKIAIPDGARRGTK